AFACYYTDGDLRKLKGNTVYLNRILDDICKVFEKPWFLKGADYYCTMSMGIVRFPTDGDTVQELIKKADLALLEAKRAGKNRCEFYTAEEEGKSFKRLDLEKNMRNAILNACNEFEVFYQPIVDVSKEDSPCMGAEALIRWNCGNLGMVSPAEFIPLAEYLGLINPIGDYVLLQACRRCKFWNDSGHPEYKVNVNLSVVQLLRNDTVDRVQDALTQTGLNPQNLTLEVTESLAINDMARMKKILGQIKELGVRVALDDFGTGYSSLNHIREMPIDVIKIDRCFIEDLGKDEFEYAFVRVVCELAQALNMNVCVEGVEYERQYEILKEMQIHMIQGFYFDKPMKAEEFEKKYL
ncbi:MAG: EAL domain-containing protein, partial [Lachnospiraceae bacterium]|nr:EAL domain-containing protein [Lachnospiraceae bacterium]